MNDDADKSLAKRVSSAAKEVVARHHLPGICVGIVRGDALIFAEGFGWADIEKREPHDLSRRHPIASLTKTMVGLCIMALVDEGKLQLDDRVTGLLPEVKFDGPAESMTLRHLLTHTSGIGEVSRPEALRSAADPNAVGEAGDFGTLFGDGILVEVPPGTKWAYCNVGFALLGEIVVRNESASLQEVMQRRIFAPLGMRDTDIHGKPDARLSSGYHRYPHPDTRYQFERAGVRIPQETTVDGHNIRGTFIGAMNSGWLGAGAVQSTIPDMTRYASALLRRGAGIVRPQTFAAMTTQQAGADPRLVTWGLAFRRTPHIGALAIGHNGAYFGGWNSHLLLFPERNLAVILHMNLLYDDSREVFSPILRAAIDVPSRRHAARRVDAAVLAAARGTYSLPMPGPLTNFRSATGVGRITLADEGDDLVLRSRWGSWKDGVVLTPCDDADPAFFAIETPGAETAYMALTRDPSGAVTGLRFDDLVEMVHTA